MGQDYAAPSIRDDFPPPDPAAWRAEAEKALKGASFERALVSDTYEQIKLQPIYNQHDFISNGLENTLPGSPPYLRGSRAGGYRFQSWLIAQEIMASSLNDYNQALLEGIRSGQTAVRLLLDHATMSGSDSDQVTPELVWCGGVPLSIIEDVHAVFDGIALSRVPVQVKTGSSGMAVAALFLAYCKRHHVSWKALNLSVETDPVWEWVRYGKLAVSLDQIFHEMTLLTDWAAKHLPAMRTIGIDVNPYHNAGANAAQELALALATGVAYLNALISRGLSVETIAPRMSFTFAIGANFFMEIAKLRAARVLWNKVIMSFGGEKELGKMHFHGRTSLWNKTIYDTYNNILRATTETFAGILGGCDSIHTGSFDELVATPDAFSRRIARNIQLILREECHADRVLDPAGGSWYVETLTRQLAEKAWEEFREIERNGGIVEALIHGIPQNSIAGERKRRIENVSKRRDNIIGINAFPKIGEHIPAVDKQSPVAQYAERLEYLQRYRTTGDIYRHLRPLEKLMQLRDARPGEVMDAVIDAAYSGATVGEITTTLRSEVSPGTPIEPVPVCRASEMFESLRKRVEASRDVPSVFLANMGPLAQYKARADFSAGFFQVAGYKIISATGFYSVEEAAGAALESGASVIVICSTDETYPDIVPALARNIREQQKDCVILLAGHPGENEKTYRAAGVDDFIHIRSNVYEFLENLSAKLGVPR